MTKQASIMVKPSVAEKLRLLSDKSGIPIARIVEELSKLADFIPQSCYSVSLVILPKTETRSIQFVLLPIYCGSFELKNGEDMDKAIREDLKKKVS